MVQCDLCFQWFHEACISCLAKPILNGDLFYAFKCACCNNGTESIERLPLSWSEALHLILYNLNLMRPSRFYRVETDIIAYAKDIWEDLQVEHLEKEATSWHKKREKLIAVLQTNKSRFRQYEKDGILMKLWGLCDPDTPPKPAGRRRRSKLKSPQILKSSVSMSDDAGKITLKISRSPSESVPRYRQMSSDDDSVFFEDRASTATPDTLKPTLKRGAKKLQSDSRPSSRNSSVLNGNGTQSLRKVAKRKGSEKGRKKQNRKRHDSYDSSFSSEAFSKPSMLGEETSRGGESQWRMMSGEGFRVMGKRVAPDGTVSYLIEWEGNTNNFNL